MIDKIVCNIFNVANKKKAYTKIAIFLGLIFHICNLVFGNMLIKTKITIFVYAMLYNIILFFYQSGSLFQLYIVCNYILF